MKKWAVCFQVPICAFVVLIMLMYLFKLQTWPAYLVNIQDMQYSFNTTTPVLPTSNFQSKILYFGITHHLNRQKALACQKTWVQTLPNMHWYSDKADVDLNATVISYEQGNARKLIVFRMVKVLEHVGKNYPDYDWYIRLWDDNYLFKERVEKLLLDISITTPVVIGRLGHIPFPENPGIYVGGGAGWVFNRGALERLYNDNGIFTCNESHIKAYYTLKRIPSRLRFAEDIHISQCFLEAGVQFIFSFGFQAQSLNHKEVKLTAKEVISGHIAAEEQTRSNSPWCHNVSCINVPNTIGIITLHYVKPSEMISLYEQQTNVSTTLL